MKKTLLVGGAGFVGNNLARKLLNDSNSVAVFDDFSTGRMSNLKDMEGKVSIQRGDVRDFDALATFVSEFKPDAIFHLAALHFIPHCLRDPDKVRSINVDGTRNLLQAVSLLKNKPRFIFISTSSVYKPRDGQIKETDDAEPFEIYGKTKLAAEKLVVEEGTKNGITYFIIRPFSIYGPFDGIPHVIPEIISQIKKGNQKIMLGNLESLRDFIFVTDVAKALSLLLDRGTPGVIYNLGAGTRHSIKEVTELFKELLKDRNIEFVSDSKLFRGEIERPCLIGDIGKIKEELNWQPEIDLRRGLELTLRAEGILA